MVVGGLVAGAVGVGVVAVAATAVGIGAIGLGLAAAHRIGSAYGMTVEQMYEQQRLAGYYNPDSYYNYSGGSGHNYSGGSSHQHYSHQPSRYGTGHSYGYR